MDVGNIGSSGFTFGGAMLAQTWAATGIGNLLSRIFRFGATYFFTINLCPVPITRAASKRKTGINHHVYDISSQSRFRCPYRPDVY
uniref:Uncharacterized protein n=1 Tax=Candidatus Kentrum sp. SD TaxID=2126332 RepID=A0A450Z3X2_9GAMM|nr:MAG: hypothetical protein BECKSD772F_GA0070984_11312 [Candidatus Kentron sp. SD]VFK48462.1 MAG: hypothetical protein BECKSD772E_GA0070983_11252 [Candidatus Kentron sp. SD]VFK79470.1 MAG: hypothetical protein BECKSD772D_GA0070982_10513 [Candidatus Kentron sp. SD]